MATAPAMRRDGQLARHGGRRTLLPGSRRASLALPLALLVARALPAAFVPAAPPRLSNRACAKASGAGALCGQAALRPTPSAGVGAAATAVASTASWLDPRTWSGAPVQPPDRLSAREWVRMYRALGLPEDASKERVLRATSRLRKKYAENEEALERVESANLWIMTRLVSRKEEALRKQQQANRLRELGDSPRKMFVKYIAGYLPPNVRQMFEAPDAKHFKLASGLLGLFALVGLCAPSQASNCVGLGAAATLGLVYRRNRPDPNQDRNDPGRIQDDDDLSGLPGMPSGGAGQGTVEKMNYKEFGAAAAVTALGAGAGAALSTAVGALAGAPFETVFCPTTCLVLWLVSLTFKVYGCFDQ